MRTILFVDVAIQPEVRFIAKQNLLMKIGNIGNLVLGAFDESTPFLMIVLMNCQTNLRINHLTAVKSVAILENSLLVSMEIPLRTAYGQNGRCGMQPKARQARRRKIKTKTKNFWTLEQKEQRERKKNARGARAGVTF
ncbi:hypothetical protein TNCV_679721 [Trichonephila clavipes]|nr:hypothetical protein TNCV_679721 [Trichonephila clavipes]